MKGLKNWHPFHQRGMKIPLPHFYVLPIDRPSVQCQNFPIHSFQNLNNSFNPKFPQTTLPCSSYKSSWLHNSHPDKLKGLAHIPPIPYLFHATRKTFHAPQSHTIRPQHPLLLLLMSPNIKIERVNAFDSILNNPSPLLLLGSSVFIGVYESPPHRFSGFPKA